MSNNRHFAGAPGISLPRSRYGMPFDHLTAFNHGKLIPIDCFPIIPGDTFSLTLSSLIRMSTPIFPIMSNIDFYVHAYFVPWRLLWKHTEEFFGANKTSSGPQTTEYLIPATDLADSSIPVNSIADYLGIPPVIGYDDTSVPALGVSMVNVLKARGLMMIWSEYYRAQQLQDPFVCDMGDTGAIGTVGANTILYSSDVPSVCKEFDYFTAATLAPQYGSAVSLPLGSYAPVVTKNEQQIWTPEKPAEAPILFATANGTYKSTAQVLGIKPENSPSRNIGVYTYTNADLSTAEGAVPVNLYADLSQATAAKINDIRYAFAVQRYLERANFGSRYFEVLNIHYGISSPDARLQRPEYLGGTRFHINIQQVLSTADYAAGVTNKVGETGAVSITANKSHIFNKGFVEFGYLYVLGFARQEQTYGQGLNREDFLRSKWEMYSPEFANLGDQEIKVKEIYAASSKGIDTFGYQEHWAELRYRPNRVSSIMNPSRTGSLDYMTLANKFTTQPSLGPAFIEENRDNITRCLTTGATGPDYVADFYCDYKATRVLPLYSVPGLVDHFGSM